MRKLIVARRLSQVACLVLFIAVFWGTTYPLKSSLSPQIFFKLDPLLMFITALSERVLLPGLIFAIVMVLLAFLLGRFFCGWICPLGTLIDWVGACAPRRKSRAKGPVVQRTHWPKFVILGLIFLSALVGLQVAWVLDPIVTVARVISLNIIPAVTLAVDGAFQFLIQRLNLYGGMYDLYRYLKDGFLGVNVYFFSNSLPTLAFFLLICGGALVMLRLWCRMFCPLGAWYALNSRMALLERRVENCTSCGICAGHCRMGAIRADGTYDKGECVLCMDCVYDCPHKSTTFGWGKVSSTINKIVPEGKGITRGQFLLLLGSALGSLGFRSDTGVASQKSSVIRPPGALTEEKFVDVCVRCGNCMKVCPTNGLQPLIGEAGWAGLWTPQLVPEIGYCEYNCTLCGEVCPTGAIPRLSVAEKHQKRLGLAVIDPSICYAWGGNKECIVCEEHCPVAEKAIKKMEDVVAGQRIWRPVVDEMACIGCGICQNKCPVRPVRAIRVKSR